MESSRTRAVHATAAVLALLSVVACQAGTSDPVLSPEEVAANLLPSVQVDGEANPRFDLAERMEFYNVPGVSIAFMDAGEIVWARGWGVADVETGREVDASTLFQAASISKPVAALTAMSMVEDDLLDLDAPINDALTSWQVPDNEFTADSAVTLRGLMTHTAGLTVWGFPGYRKDEPFAEGQAMATNVQVLDGQGNTDEVRVYKEPGISWQYSGGGYTVMEQALEDVTGRPFHEIAAGRVLEPAGMMSSTYEQPLPGDLWSRASRAYQSDGSEVEGEWHNYPEQAAAGLWTTPSDLVTLGGALTRILAGQDGDGVVSPAALEAMTTGHRSDEEGFDDYGMGFGVYGGDPVVGFGHGGANAGFRSQWIVLPEAGQAVAVMTNGDQGGSLQAEVLRGMADLLGWSIYLQDTRTARPLSGSEASEYVGVYEDSDRGIEVTITDLSDRLGITDPNGSEFVLRAWADREDTFFDPGDGQVIEFSRGPDGSVDGLVAGGQVRLVRRD